ncbi:hypothetical protein LSTR_LSTR009069 [Laodelphax striatellus]|uniref:PH domain-containing protein n=1 Tax=Laodelphax striatellus TaxID=195883 RepID=A0A482XNN3_LAOST|nr:hypothetical protein LSTR_LSTR009069 [Laodelphax striatellus]
MAVPGNSVANSAVLFREVHKNAWLRRLPTEEKKIGAHSKKGERVWCVFCVHDDVEPFIEIYADQKMAAAHKPDWCASLSHTLHVSPTICARDDEFEFVVTLPDTALRLSAPSWEVMMEWVESIGGKLREMHVLSPRENLYSRQPESRAPLLPTRDPNSPLPPPPASVPPMLVPGVEALTLNTPSQPHPHPDSQNITVIQVDPIDYQPSTAETSSGLISTLIYCDDNDVDDDTFNEDEDSLDDDQDVFGEDVASVCPPLPRLPCQLNRTNHSCDRNRNSQNNCNNSSQLIEATSNHRGSNNTQLNNRVIEVEGAATTSNHRSSNNTQVNNRLIEVEGAPTTSNHRSSNNTQLTSQLVGVEGAPLTSNHRGSNNSQLIGIEGAPTVPSHRGGNNSQLIGVEGAATTSNHRNTQLTSQLIEVEGAATDSPSTSNQSSHRSISRSRTGNDSGHVTRHPAADSDSRVEPPASPVTHEHVFLASSPASPPPPPAEDATAASSSSSSPPPLSADLRYSQVQDRVVPPVNAIRPRSGLRPNRRRSSDSSVPADRIRRLQAPPHPFRQPVAGAVEAGAGVTLRERQVQQLRREMTHQGGVRLQLRRKDCLE